MGDRATQLNKLEFPAYNITYGLEIPLEAHRSVSETFYFKIPFKIIDEKLDCAFILRHTNGNETIKVTSTKVSSSPSLSGTGYKDWGISC